MEMMKSSEPLAYEACGTGAAGILHSHSRVDLVWGISKLNYLRSAGKV